jgi:LmbE family N-acetylglucosaminyl deacetylase
MFAPKAGINRVLVLGAHSDDAEIGAGGTIRSLVRERPDIEVRWVVFAAAARERAEEAQASAREILGNGNTRIVETHDFRDGFLPYEGAEVKEVFEKLKSFNPDLVLTHQRDDLHQDHRLVCELTWNTFRDHMILEYEVPKYDGDMGSPNFFSPLPADIVEAKVDGLMRFFASQRSKMWFTSDTFRALMRLRGMECRAPSGFAEAFYARKAVWSL